MSLSTLLCSFCRRSVLTRRSTATKNPLALAIRQLSTTQCQQQVKTNIQPLSGLITHKICSASTKAFFSTLHRNPTLLLHGKKLISVEHVRWMGQHVYSQKQRNTIINYALSVIIVMLGMGYAGVPLYKMFCQAKGLGGQAMSGHDTSKVETMSPVEREIRILFNADTASAMQWNFRPHQTQITVKPGETALAFYRAKNPTDRPIIGISTYNVLPFDAAPYFNKIQCFCFEEQRLNPHEQVDMPVFFYIDPEFAEDPALEKCDTIHLSYTFFEAKEGLQLPLPGYTQPYSRSTTPA